MLNIAHTASHPSATRSFMSAVCNAGRRNGSIEAARTTAIDGIIFSVI
jgi:hypothetical protein